MRCHTWLVWSHTWCTAFLFAFLHCLWKLLKCKSKDLKNDWVVWTQCTLVANAWSKPHSCITRSKTSRICVMYNKWQSGTYELNECAFLLPSYCCLQPLTSLPASHNTYHCLMHWRKDGVLTDIHSRGCYQYPKFQAHKSCRYWEFPGGCGTALYCPVTPSFVYFDALYKGWTLTAQQWLQKPPKHFT